MPVYGPNVISTYMPPKKQCKFISVAVGKLMIYDFNSHRLPKSDATMRVTAVETGERRFNPHHLPRSGATAAGYKNLPLGPIVTDARTSFQCLLFPPGFSCFCLQCRCLLTLKPLETRLRLLEFLCENLVFSSSALLGRATCLQRCLRGYQWDEYSLANRKL